MKECGVKKKKRVAKQFERDCKNHRRIQWATPPKHCHYNLSHNMCTPNTNSKRERMWARAKFGYTHIKTDAIANGHSHWKCTELNSSKTKLKLSEAWVNYIAKNKTISQFTNTHTFIYTIFGGLCLSIAKTIWAIQDCITA